MEKPETIKQKNRNFFKNLGWILFLILLVLIIGAFIGKRVLAIPQLPQEAYCNVYYGINMTENKTACDKVWCSDIISNINQNCSYSDNFCLCKQNILISSNITINQTQNITSFNITDIDSNLANMSNTSIFAASIREEAKEYADNITMALRDALLNRINNISSQNYYQPVQDTSWPWWGIAILMLIAGGVIVFLVTNKKKETQIARQYRKDFSGADNFQEEKPLPLPVQQKVELSEEEKMQKFLERMKAGREKAKLEREAKKNKKKKQESEEEGEEEI